MESNALHRREQRLDHGQRLQAPIPCLPKGRVQLHYPNCGASGCNLLPFSSRRPTSSYVAFLRAINVGGHTVKMDRLRSLFEEIGLQNVSTFIASGNVIFASPEKPEVLGRKISEHLERALGYPVGTFLRTPEALAVVASHPPFSEEEVARAAMLYVCFLPEAPGESTRRAVQAVGTPTQELRVHGRELYWLTHTRYSDSDVDARALDRALGMSMTMRNLNTVRRILAKTATQ